MIMEEKFYALRMELSRARLSWEKKVDGYRLFFNGHASFHDFQQNLDTLYFEYVHELRLYLASLETNNEVCIYLDMLCLHLEMLNEQIGEQPGFEFSHKNAEVVSHSKNPVRCVNPGPVEFSEMIAYFRYQKVIIEKAIKMVNNFQKHYKQAPHPLPCFKSSWIDELKEFYPNYSELRADLYEMNSIPEKIQYVKEVRKKVYKEFQDKGINPYNSPLSIFFDARIETYLEILNTVQISSAHSSVPLKWNCSKSDFLEWILSFDLKQVLLGENGKPLSRRALIRELEAIFGVDPISDADSRISKLMGRSDISPFLKSLVGAVEDFAVGEYSK